AIASEGFQCRAPPLDGILEPPRSLEDEGPLGESLAEVRSHQVRLRRVQLRTCLIEVARLRQYQSQTHFDPGGQGVVAGDSRLVDRRLKFGDRFCRPAELSKRKPPCPAGRRPPA